MILTTKDINSICFGALRIEERDGWICFNRFTEEQERIYTSHNFSPREKSTSSVMLDFHTDSERLDFDYRVVPGSSRKLYYFDVYADGVMVYHGGEAEAELCQGHVSAELGAGMKRVCVHFPWSYGAKISNVILDDGATIRRSEKKLKALILGDSITQGYTADYPSLTYANLLIEELGLDAVNQAVGGEIFRAENLGSVPVCEPDIITVAYGTNDWSKLDIGRIDADAESYFARLRALYPRARVIYISPIWRADKDMERPSGSFDTHCNRLIAIARSHGAFAVDGRKLTPHVKSVFEDRRLHPNDLGFTQYARLLVKAIEGVIS